MKQTLCKLEVDDSNFAMIIGKHAKKSQDTIPPNPKDISCFIASASFPGDIYCPYPLCRLLDKEEFCPKEIPLSILELLVTAGFHVNGTSGGEASLHTAIASGHYNAVRWLVEHGADCNAVYNKTTPIARLAPFPNVPLDLFDLLKTPKNLNEGRDKRSPLHGAVQCNRVSSALRLISLGAEVDKIDGVYDCLPIMCYINKYQYNNKLRYMEDIEFHEELFIKLLPRCMDYVEIIRTVMSAHFKPDVTSKMVYPLIQRHVNTGSSPLSIPIPNYYDPSDKYWVFYLDTLLVLLLDLDVAQEPFVSLFDFFGLIQEPDIAEMWKTEETQTKESWKQVANEIREVYDQRLGKVKSLFKLCIQCTRKSMRSLDDNSFQSLPLPAVIRNQLKLRDVAKLICEAWELWPKCFRVEDILENCKTTF